MKLSELKTGESGVIVKVLGHGGFRKRIIEMGFVRGKTVEVLLNAPLQDPVKYKLMGYEVSLRHDEAAMIEVVSEAEAKQLKQMTGGVVEEDVKQLTDSELRSEALRQRRRINVALVGNPNCGKTSLFNFASGAHGHVGNYSGVTVDASEAHASFFGYEFNLTDLPGTYSLSCYSPEELYVRQHLSGQMPDVVINVIDASNLERNLYLTTQLVDMDLRLVCALNMYDEFERRGDQVDLTTLSTLFGVPMVPTSFKSGMGVEDLFRMVIKVYENARTQARHIHINYGHEIEDGISEIQKYLKTDEHITPYHSTRYLSLKLLEHDSQVLDFLGKHMAGEQRLQVFRDLATARDRASARVKEETGVDAETAIMDRKYGFINGALKEAGYKTGSKTDTYRMTHLIDNILSNKYLGFPIFFFILFIMFQTTFALGQYPMDWIDSGVAWLSELISSHMSDGPLKDLLVDGILAGVGGVIVFLPNILILYAFISWMEDSGYMARAAFIMDKIMHKMGLHGKSFIPMIMGFGCNIPAIMATRTIEDRKSRLITMLIVPLMSCSARLPVYIIIIGAFFPKNQALILFTIYLIGIVMSVLMAHLFSRFVVKGESSPFVMELPPYRLPSGKSVVRHTWEKGKQYLKKMGTIILAASIVVWALTYFPHHDELTSEQQMEQSYIGQLGKAVEPVIRPCGLQWKEGVSLITGVGAKEIVASTMGVLYATSAEGTEAEPEDLEDSSHLSQIIAHSGMTPLSAFAFLVFVLLYMPCLPACIAIKNESGRWRWALFTACYTTALAWICATMVYQVGMLL